MKPRLPPYGRQVATVLARRDQLETYSGYAGCTRDRATIYLATGPGAWDWRNERPQHLTVVLLAAADPADFNWSFLRGHEPILTVGSGEDDIEASRAVASALHRDGVQAVMAGRVLMAHPGYSIAVALRAGVEA